MLALIIVLLMLLILLFLMLLTADRDLAYAVVDALLPVMVLLSMLFCIPLMLLMFSIMCDDVTMRVHKGRDINEF